MNPVIDAMGNRYWRNEINQFHREDGPAVIYHNGTKIWYKNGLYHREGGPAIEWNDGSKHWYINGLRHREDGPAVEELNGYKWYYHGKEILCKNNKKFLQLIKLRMYW